MTLDTGETIPGDLGVIVAVKQPQAEKLLPQLSTREKAKKSERSTVCLYFSTYRAPVQDPILLLNGSGKGIVNNMFFATNVAPSYAPAGKVLVSVSLVGSFADREDADLADEVIRELGGWFSPGEVASWTHLRTYRIGFAQPDQTPPTTPAGRDREWVKDCTCAATTGARPRSTARSCPEGGRPRLWPRTGDYALPNMSLCLTV